MGARQFIMIAGTGWLLLTVILPGCAGPAYEVLPAGSAATSLGNADAAELTADDVVAVMRRAGFADEHILEFGTDMRNAIAQTGGARIRLGEHVEAVFAVSGNYLYASSYRRGSFTYDLETRSLLAQ